MSGERERQRENRSPAFRAIPGITAPPTRMSKKYSARIDYLLDIANDYDCMFFRKSVDIVSLFDVSLRSRRVRKILRGGYPAGEGDGGCPPCKRDYISRAESGGNKGRARGARRWLATPYDYSKTDLKF